MTWVIFHLLILGLLAAAFLPAFIVGCFEKRLVRMFERFDMGAMPPYMTDVHNRALANGFTFQCTGRFLKWNGRLFGALFLSADRQILAFCTDGIPVFRRTVLISQFNDGSLLMTLDAFGTAELDQLTEWQITPRVGFAKMLRRHQAKMDARVGAKQFPSNADWSAVTDVYRAKAERIIARGLARYVDAEHDVTRYTPWGSFRATVLYGLGLLHRPKWMLDQFFSYFSRSRDTQAVSTDT